MPRTAAVAEQPKLEKGKTFTFRSRHGRLRLVRVGQAVVPDGWGGQVTRERWPDTHPGVTRVVYEFERGVLEVVVGGKNWHELPDGPDGETLSTVDWLRLHGEFNVRFFEDGNEPDRQLPTEEDFMDRVNAASVALDVDAIADLLRQERESHNRPNLVTVADNARKRTLRARQELEAQGPPDPGEAA